MLGLLLWRPLPATLIAGPDLARRIDKAGAIIAGKLVRGRTLASGSQVSSDIVLHVDRVLKGDLIPGTDIAAHLEGRGMFVEPQPKQSAVPQQVRDLVPERGPVPIHRDLARRDAGRTLLCSGHSPGECAGREAGAFTGSLGGQRNDLGAPLAGRAAGRPGAIPHAGGRVSDSGAGRDASRLPAVCPGRLAAVSARSELPV